MEDIDSLTNAFAVSQVTIQENSIAAPHPSFSNLYKKKNSVSQEERRRRFLVAQKEKRYDYSVHARKLATEEWSDDEDNENEEMDCEQIIIEKPSRSYKNQLMHSEWLVEVPSDLASQWLMVPCPVGKRSLVIASRGRTKVFSRAGYFINSFFSKLPGGGRRNNDVPCRAYSILDCIYCNLSKTYYILDIMCWRAHPFYDAETEFRLYWKKQKVADNPEISVESKDNPYKFIPLLHFNCDKETIYNTLNSPLPFEEELDGLLFFHKQCHYICGSTPLVTWLKAYMVPEILGILVPDSLCSDKPADYVNMQQQLPKVFAKHERRKVAEEKNMQYED